MKNIDFIKVLQIIASNIDFATELKKTAKQQEKTNNYEYDHNHLFDIHEMPTDKLKIKLKHHIAEANKTGASKAHKDYHNYFGSYSQSELKHRETGEDSNPVTFQQKSVFDQNNLVIFIITLVNQISK